MSVGLIQGNSKGVYAIKATLTPASVATITTAEQTFTVPTLAVGDLVFVNSPSLVAGVAVANARVSAANTLAITFVNPTAGSVTPASGSYTILVIRPENGTQANSVQD